MANRPRASSRSSQGPRLPAVALALGRRTVGIIGAGKMGQAMIKGLLAHGLGRRQLQAADPSAAMRRRAHRRFRVRVHAENARLVRSSQVVILAVKPQQFPEMLEQIAPWLTPRHLVISIAAGVSLRWLRASLPGVALVRVMPNLPATVGRGFAAFAAGPGASARHRAVAQAIFGSVGEVVELPERYFDAVTAVSGSGPAYVFFFLQALEESARRLGLPLAVAGGAVRQTLRGSLDLLEATGEEPRDLIAKVASKGGTTEAALRVLARRRVSAHLAEALRAAAKRSRELSWLSTKS